jgi:hypothetical protein
MSRFRALGLALAFHLVALSAVGLTAAPAEAQSISPGRLTLGGMDLHLFRPAMDSKGYLSVNGTDILGHLDISFGLIVDGGFGLLPYDSFVNDQTVSSADAERCGSGFLCGRLVNYLFTGTLHANLGLFNIMEIGLQVPLAFSAGDNRTTRVPRLRLRALHRRPRRRRLPRRRRPCPDEPEDFDHFEDRTAAPSPTTTRTASSTSTTSARSRRKTATARHDEDGCPDRDNNDRDGDGILDNVDQCPDDPEDRDNFEDTDGCPDPDNDRDGILDRVDLCPNDPEDRDNFEDENGCPDPDNDHDRIPDVRDRCPNEPETYNAHEDEDGCPDQGVACSRRTPSASSRRSTSRPTRADPPGEPADRRGRGGDAHRANPQIQLLQVQGHADERGNDDHNLQLTSDRAASVVEALVERGVERRPAARRGLRRALPGQNPGRGNAAAWARNRRVVFLSLPGARASHVRALWGPSWPPNPLS